MTSNIYRSSFPAIHDGWVITQGHVNACVEFGHATYKIDGVIQGICPRCGVLTAAEYGALYGLTSIDDE